MFSHPPFWKGNHHVLLSLFQSRVVVFSVTSYGNDEEGRRCHFYNRNKIHGYSLAAVPIFRLPDAWLYFPADGFRYHKATDFFISNLQGVL